MTSDMAAGVAGPRLVVTGGRRLAGQAAVSGAKNSALKLMAASLLARGTSVLHNVPDIQDVRTMQEVLVYLGAMVEFVDGSMTVERFRDVVGIDTPLPEEEQHAYHTVAGFVMLQLGRVPQVGDKFQWGRLQVEVLDMDRNRIDKLLVAVLPDERPAADG